MEKDTDVVPRGQGKPNTLHQRVNGTHLTLRDDLYSRRLPEGETIPILVHPVSIADRPPKGEDITVAARRLRTGRAGGPPVIAVEQLKA